MSLKKSVSIIIPNYNGQELLEKYLPDTIAAADNAEIPYEIIVVDDASSDRSVDFIRRNYPQVIVHANKENRGFSYTCNTGISIAKYELLLFLNSDVKLTPDYFENQWQYFEREDTFGVMGRIMNMGKDKIEDAARFPIFVGCKLKASKFFYSKKKNVDMPTTYLSGANALVDAGKMKELGGFDEIFTPFYSEDLDLSLRAWRMGWKCYYEHQSTCYHHVSYTTNRHHEKDSVMNVYYRNKFLVHAIHLNGVFLWIWYFQLFFLEILPKLFIGKTWIIKSYISFFQYSNEIEKSRQKLSSLMKSNDSHLTLFDVKRRVDSELKEKDIVWL